jgi:hypothetical protein
MKNIGFKTPPKQIWFLIFGILLTLNSRPALAQINAFVGYAYSQNRDQNRLNSIVERYNTRNPTLLQPMTMLNALHGVDLGIRYRFSAVSIEFNWFNKFNQINDRVMTADKTEYKNVLYYKSQSYCLGIEFYRQWFGVGASLDWNNLVIRKEKSTDRIKMDWLKEGGLSNHFFLNFEVLMNDAMALSIRPYVQVPMYKNDFYNIESKLNPDIAPTLDPSVYKQKVTNWGIKFLFMNGTKNP